MRANGVRSLAVSCLLYHHQAALDGRITPRCRPSVRAWCTRLRDNRRADARPNWSERPERPTLTGVQWL
jgi:hypothetical protein